MGKGGSYGRLARSASEGDNVISPTLEDAIALATVAHTGQLDAAGAPYIDHPLTVMRAQTDDEARMVAILHDVVEDTDVTLDALRSLGYSETILAALDCLTRRSGETYATFITRVKRNPLAVRVKLADLAHNMDLSRFNQAGKRESTRLVRYQKAWFELTGQTCTEATRLSVLSGK